MIDAMVLLEEEATSKSVLQGRCLEAKKQRLLAIAIGQLQRAMPRLVDLEFVAVAVPRELGRAAEGAVGKAGRVHSGKSGPTGWKERIARRAEKNHLHSMTVVQMDSTETTSRPTGKALSDRPKERMHRSREMTTDPEKKLPVTLDEYPMCFPDACWC